MAAKLITRHVLCAKESLLTFRKNERLDIEEEYMQYLNSLQVAASNLKKDNQGEWTIKADSNGKYYIRRES